MRDTFWNYENWMKWSLWVVFRNNNWAWISLCPVKSINKWELNRLDYNNNTIIVSHFRKKNNFHHSFLRSCQGRSRRCIFASWDKGQCPHGALFHAVPGCCKCFQQCRIAGTARVGTLGSYQIDTIGSTSNTQGQRGTMLHEDTVPCRKEQSCIVWTDL